MKSRRAFLFVVVLLAVSSWYLLQQRSVRLPPASPRPPGALSLIVEPEAGITPILGLIRGARSEVDLVMYQFQDRDVADALIEAQKRGVRVRVLLNHGYRGQADPINEPAYAFLLSHGVAVKWTSGLYDLTHEKSIEVDNRLLLVMTFNLTPRYYASGREFGIYDRDGADIKASQVVFEADWHSLRTRAPTADGLVWSPGAEQTLLGLISNARTSLDIYNEEMADEPIMVALENAVRRGVIVRVCMTYATPWKEPFIALARAGVQVKTYSGTASLYIHAKMILADNQRAFVGSQNFSVPSLEANRELGLILTSKVVVAQLSSVFVGDWAGARTYLMSQ